MSKRWRAWGVAGLVAILTGGAWGQAPKHKTLQEGLRAMSLVRWSQSMQQVHTQVAGGAAQTGGPAAQKPKLDPAQLQTLYGALRNAEQARVSYVAGLDLYMQAVNANASEADRKARRDAFGESARGMQKALAELNAAFRPLELGADLNWPVLSQNVRRYAGEQQAGVVHFSYADVIRSLSPGELNSLQKKVHANGAILQAALDQTEQALRAAYAS